MWINNYPEMIAENPEELLQQESAYVARRWKAG